jgi:general secretion pathway protein G
MSSPEIPGHTGSPAGKTSGMAIASLILGILGITVVGLILGIIALKKITSSSGRLGGKGLAIAGIIVSGVLMALQCLMIPLILLSLFATANFSSNVENTKVAATKMTLRDLHEAVNRFKLDTGRYPTEEEGLSALFEAPADTEGRTGPLETMDIPRDAWKNELVFMLNPANGTPFVIISLGADGKAGGSGYDEDIYSTDRE